MEQMDDTGLEKILDVLAIPEEVEFDREAGFDEKSREEIENLADMVGSRDTAFQLAFGNPKNYLRLAVALYYIGSYFKAEEFADKALKLAPEEKAAWFVKGLSQLRTGNQKKAIKSLDEYLKRENTPRGWYYKGEALRLKRNFERALECFDQALELDSEHVPSLLSKAHSLIDLERGTEARDHYDRAIELDPEAEKKREEKLKEIAEKGERKNAHHFFELVLEVDPKNAKALKGAAESLASRGKYEDAVPFFDRLVEVEPSPESRERRERCLDALKKKRKCPDCGGTGKCPSCKGEVKCKKCKGKGKCRKCRGKGYCTRCGGTGDCHQCGGKGRVMLFKTCDLCEGTGECIRCDGTGDCEGCDNTGKCKACKGKGHCDVCDGSGKCLTCDGTGIRDGAGIEK